MKNLYQLSVCWCRDDDVMKVVGSLQIRNPLDAGQRSDGREPGSRGGMPTKFCSGTLRCDNHKARPDTRPQEPVTECKEFVVIGKIMETHMVRCVDI